MTNDKEVYGFFWVSVTLKGLISLAEVAAGVAALFIPKSVITAFITLIATHHILGDPSGFLAVHAAQSMASFSSELQTFVAFYLLTRGIIKLFLIGALLKNKLWAYPISLIVLGLFVLYQLYQITITGSLIIIGITLFDLIVMSSIWLEYRAVKKNDVP